ncbi:MAG: multicopper oxidase domain-containing protein [Actinomycetes bacterium]
MTTKIRGLSWPGGIMLLALMTISLILASAARAETPAGTIDPTAIPKYQEPLVIPPAMPLSGTKKVKGRNIDYYEITMKQFQQYILPQTWSTGSGIGPTTVWSYASMMNPLPVAQGGTLNYPALTVEARYNRAVRVKWINGLVDKNGDYLPHLLAVDQTLHWANPPGGPGGTDKHGMDPAPYTGPVPIVTHVHGAHTTQDSDGFPEAWYLPNARNIPAGYATGGTYYEQFKKEFEKRWGTTWQPGSAIFQYPNDQRATTLWYHDHTLGMTRVNVYAGPAGFYLLRGGPDDLKGAALPGPAPQRGDAPGLTYREIPIAIQDRTFKSDGSLFYPDNRAFFEGLNVPGREPQFPGEGELRIPFIPDMVPGGMESDIEPIWNPETFGNTIVVNGKTWPYLDVEQSRYRLRLLNGSQARFLILKLDNGMPFWQIGSEGGFLPNPVRLTELLIAPAERADVIVDFSRVPEGTHVVLENLGPDEPFGGGEPGDAFEPANPDTTGQVMQFRVGPRHAADPSVAPAALRLPELTPIGAPVRSRDLSLNEMMSMTVKVKEVEEDEKENVVFDPNGEAFGPREALLGTYNPATKVVTPMKWMDPVSETVKRGQVEQWAFHNFTADAHPIHVHLVQFQVVSREVVDPEVSPHGDLGAGAVLQPAAWEYGFKDTVIAYPGEITRIKARFDIAGMFVWHCHIIEHEDNEMMRPYRVVN